jgi:hypothetical protein
MLSIKRLVGIGMLMVLGLLLMPKTVSANLGTNLYINEVDADQTGTDSAEFVEIYSLSPNISLTGTVLVFFNGNATNDTSYQAFDLDGQTTDANGFFVLCGNAANVANCDMDVTPDTNLIQNGTDAIALYFGDAADFPGGTAPTTANLIDALVYDTGDSDDTALQTALGQTKQIDEDAHGMGVTESIQLDPTIGLPTSNLANASYYVTTPTPGFNNSPTAVSLQGVQLSGQNTTASIFLALTLILAGYTVFTLKRKN